MKTIYLIRNAVDGRREVGDRRKVRSGLSGPTRYLSATRGKTSSLRRDPTRQATLMEIQMRIASVFSVVVDINSQKEEGVGREEDRRGKACSHHLSRRLCVCACYGLCVDYLVWWVTTFRLG